MTGLSEPFRPWWQDKLDELESSFPSHDVWFTSGYPDPGAWSAKPKGHKTATLIRSTPEELSQAIQDELSGRNPVRDLLPRYVFPGSED